MLEAADRSFILVVERVVRGDAAVQEEMYVQELEQERGRLEVRRIEAAHQKARGEDEELIVPAKVDDEALDLFVAAHGKSAFFAASSILAPARCARSSSSQW